MNSNSRAFLFLLLGLLTAFAPLMTDMYLPTLPAMGRYFQTSASMVQLGLSASMLGLAIGQLLFGPWSDRVGRRQPLLISLWLFVVATFLCIISPSIEFFLAARLGQGLAGSGGIVLARSIAADRFSGAQLTKALAIVGAINGLAPVLAPIVGGLCADSLGWRGIFAILLGLGLVILALSYRYVETLPPSLRQSEGGMRQLVRSLAQVAVQAPFRLYTLQLATAQGLLFANIASSPFIIQSHFGQSPIIFSLCFALNSLGITLGAAFALRFASLEEAITWSSRGLMVGTLAIAGLLAGGGGLVAYEILMTAVCFFLGMTFTASTSLAMDLVRSQAGAGSALLGAVGFVVGGAIAPLVGWGQITVSTPAVMVSMALITALLAWRARKALIEAKASLLVEAA